MWSSTVHEWANKGFLFQTIKIHRWQDLYPRVSWLFVSFRCNFFQFAPKSFLWIFINMKPLKKYWIVMNRQSCKKRWSCKWSNKIHVCEHACVCVSVCVLFISIFINHQQTLLFANIHQHWQCASSTPIGHWLRVCVRMDCQTSNWLDPGLALKSYWTKTSQSTLDTQTHMHTQKN